MSHSSQSDQCDGLAAAASSSPLCRSDFRPVFTSITTLAKRAVRVSESNKGVLFGHNGWKIVDFKHGKEKEGWRQRGEEKRGAVEKVEVLIANGIPLPALLEK